MATVTKDFKVKSGLVVEGATATVNNYDVLTKKQEDQDYIVDLIGGTATPENTPNTVVKRDGNGNFVANQITANEVVVQAAGQIYEDSALNIDSNSGYDINISANQNVNINTANADVNLNPDGQVKIWGKEVATKEYADGVVSTTQSNLDDHISDTSAHGVTGDVVGTTDSQSLSNKTIMGQTYFQSSGGAGGSNNYIDVNNSNGKLRVHSGYALDLTASNDVTVESTGGNIILSADGTSYLGSATSGNEIATQGYADNAATNAVSTANSYTDTKVADLVDSAPALLDTLNELAAAIENNPNYATDVANLVASKADTTYVDQQISSAGTTAENNAKSYADTVAGNAYTDATLYVDSAISTEVTNRNSAIDNAINAINTDDVEEGQNNLYFTNSRVENAMIDPITLGTQTNISVTYNTGTGTYDFVAENGVAGSTTSDLVEGSNLYFTDARAVSALEAVVPNFTEIDLNNIVTNIATQATVATASQVTAHEFDSAVYRSAEYTVKVAYGSHTELSKVMVTLDSANNIAITEYAVVGTNGSASTITADVNGGNVRLRVTTANNNSVVTVFGTIIK